MNTRAGLLLLLLTVDVCACLMVIMFVRRYIDILEPKKLWRALQLLMLGAIVEATVRGAGILVPTMEVGLRLIARFLRAGTLAVFAGVLYGWFNNRSKAP